MTTSVISWLAGTVRTLQKRIDALEASLELHTSTQNVIQLRSGRIPNPAKPVIISLETCLPLESAAAMKQTSTDTSLRELLHKQIDVRLSSEGLILMGHDEVAA
eukprot:TRINITY_DN10729_c0_g2_i1.p1 TRINITY_DN10729_c0_g2~~TRINITY_DN10729_c0_g2_i1.p1  ORF type:complete len:104 (+),score=13.31 TRINITY_DN10729_c0_g2_i1:86-397(+)